MNIALIILKALPHRGGAEAYTDDLSRALVARGHEVTLVALEFSPLEAPAKKVLLQIEGSGRARRIRRFMRKAHEHISAGQYDVVHAMLPVVGCDLYHPHASLAAEWFASWHLKKRGRRRQAMAWLATRFNGVRRVQRAVEIQMLQAERELPWVLCFSEVMRQGAPKLLGIDRTRAVLLRNGSDLKKFDATLRPDERERIRRELGFGTGTKVALFLGQAFETKGLGEAMEAMARCGREDLALVVLGAGDRPPFERLASLLGIGGRVKFIGHASDPYPYYQAADFVVFPAHGEVFGLVVTEAMAMGKPVIVSRQAGAHEVVEHGKHGYVLGHFSDVIAMANHFNDLSDDVTRARLSEACLRHREAISFEGHMEELLKIYARVIEIKKRAIAKDRLVV